LVFTALAIPVKKGVIMIKKVKRLAAATSIAAVAAVTAVTGATAGVASARVLGSSGIEPGLSPVRRPAPAQTCPAVVLKQYWHRAKVPRTQDDQATARP
jgi:hypothetical protein